MIKHGNPREKNLNFELKLLFFFGAGSARVGPGRVPVDGGRQPAHLRLRNAARDAADESARRPRRPADQRRRLPGLGYVAEKIQTLEVLVFKKMQVDLSTLSGTARPICGGADNIVIVRNVLCFVGRVLNVDVQCFYFHFVGYFSRP